MPNDRFLKVKSVLDSGATDSCAPDCMCPEVKSGPSEGSRRGQMYTAAGGKKIANEGEKDITMVTGPSEIVQICKLLTFQTALQCEADLLGGKHRVLFGAQGGVICKH